MAALFLVGVSATLHFELHELIDPDFFPGHARAVTILLGQLGRADPPRATPAPPCLTRETVLYVLGGSRASLQRKFELAALRYREGDCARIVVLHEPGKNEYQPLLRRNLTNDEWALGQLLSLGVRQEDVELLTVKPAFWGTLAEASHLAEFVQRRSYRRLILVTSLPHTRRVRQSFSCLLRGVKVDMCVLASDEAFSLRDLLVEYLKVTIYNAFLLPRYCASGG